MSQLIPCSACQSHVFATDRTCPHCGASLRSGMGKSAAVLVGLALTGCPTTFEPVYGESDTVDTDSAGTDTGTDTGETTDTTDGGMDSTGGVDTGEPEYGVPDTGTDTTSG